MKNKTKQVQREMERLASRVLAILRRSWLGRSLLRTICNGGEVGDEFYLLTRYYLLTHTETMKEMVLTMWVNNILIIPIQRIQNL